MTRSPNHLSVARNSNGLAVATRRVPCEKCPLRDCHSLREFSADELKFVSNFKSGELNVQARTSILLQGTNSAHLYTVLGGWAIRYKSLQDGRRQILNYVMPSDFIGLQGTIADEMQHSVEALTDVTLCVFPREKLWDLYSNHPTLAYDVTWLAARSEQHLDDHLLSLGRRSALERMAYLFIHLFTRAGEVGLTKGQVLKTPFNQQHVADTLGMSLVHANKTLKRLTATKAIRWSNSTLEILNRDELIVLAGYEPPAEVRRPFI